MIRCEQSIDDRQESERTIVGDLKLSIVSNDIENARYGRHDERASNLPYCDIND